MPRFDGTGPQGAGPMTGGGRGYCNSRRQNRFYGSTAGFRGGDIIRFQGNRYGWRNRQNASEASRWLPPTSEQEIDRLSSLANQLKTDLENIQKRIEELKS